jgi:hypothetical protein
MNDEQIRLLRSIAADIERIADAVAPRPRESRIPAVLGTAAYTEEERDAIELKAELKKREAEIEKRRIAEKAGSFH